MTVVLFLSFERSFKLLSFMKNVKNVLIPWLYVLEKNSPSQQTKTNFFLWRYEKWSDFTFKCLSYSI